jgi:hypothetical protein
VADNIGGGVVQLAAVEAELEDGDSSSDAGYQAGEEGRRRGAEPLTAVTTTFGTSCSGVSELG